MTRYTLPGRFQVGCDDLRPFATVQHAHVEVLTQHLAASERVRIQYAFGTGEIMPTLVRNSAWSLFSRMLLVQKSGCFKLRFSTYPDPHPDIWFLIRGEACAFRQLVSRFPGTQLLDFAFCTRALRIGAMVVSSCSFGDGLIFSDSSEVKQFFSWPAWNFRCPCAVNLLAVYALDWPSSKAQSNQSSGIEHYSETEYGRSTIYVCLS